MTFSSKVKTEILSQGIPEGNEIAMLCGVIISAGTITISNKQMSFSITSENYELLKFIKKIIGKTFPHAVVELPENKKNLNRRITLNLDPVSANEILFDCGILNHDDFGRVNISLVGDSHLLIEDDGKKAYLSGAFLGGGSISVPNHSTSNKTGGYHMEWSFSSSNQADAICEILAYFDIFAKMVERGDNYVVYIKGSEQIGTVIALMGASDCYLELESELVSRQMRNLVNRQSNCISANIDKAVSAGLKQIEAINLISSTIGLDSLPESLKEVANIRLRNPEATLLDIVEMLGGKISKSAVNLRFRKIMEIAKELGDAND